MKDYEDMIEKGTFYRVNLSTRITQNACNKLAEIQGWLQTERPLSTVSKQEAIEKAILHYHEFIMQANCMHDEARTIQDVINENEASNQQDQTKVVSMQNASKLKTTRQIDVEAYREMTKYNGSGW